MEDELFFGLAPSWLVGLPSRLAGRHLATLYFLKALFVAAVGGAREAAELRTGSIVGPFGFHCLPSADFVFIEGQEGIEALLLVFVFICCLWKIGCKDLICMMGSLYECLSL